ncbi:MAG: AbrB/MazE/SpoVT family DNA-binding domain-containing protein, partial [Flammeovirgaceae bacterium]
MPKILTDTLVVDGKGAVRIPIRVRKAQKIKPGTVLKLEIVDEKLVFEVQEDPIDELCGILADGTNHTQKFL